MTAMDPEILEVFSEEATERIDRMVETLLALESGHAASDAIDSLFRDAHSIKGSAGMVGLEDVHAIAHQMEDSLEGPREQGAFPPELADSLLRQADELRRAVTGDGVPKPAAAAAPESPQAAEPTRPAERRSVRMSTDKVDRLFDAVGETVLHNRRLEHLLTDGTAPQRDDERLEGELGHGELLLDELQDSVIQMRTLPLSSISGAYPRAVRDLAAAHDKQVELRITGDDTPLDRMILDGISESISHLLRNCVAHGIESPVERERAGKPATGHIELRAGQRGSQVAIEVIDDGRGVSAELIESAQAGHTLADLLSEAGFSTAEEVSDVSGRGVGLDAVKAHVESLRGALEVESEPGHGTTVTMLLPLTLALLRVLLLERGGQTFGLGLPSVEEVVTVTDTMALGGREALEVRGRSVPLADLAELLGAEAGDLPDRPDAVIVASFGGRVGVVCDRVVGEQEVVVKSLGPVLAAVPCYLGAAIMGDGSVALIVDPAFLVRRQAGAAARVHVGQEGEASTVLVVDDQFTVRELQRSILEAAGYRVETARDGQEALTKVGGSFQVDLVVTDVDMPQMSGIELLRAIRDDPRSFSLPVVVVTGRGGAEDRKLGMEAGADAYIVKDEFDQRTLLETVGRLLAAAR
jgi:two-component system, chemotaxis family, sensor kinase CheA